MTEKKTNLMPALAMMMALGVSQASGVVVINEFFADDTGGDNAEFIELFGAPSESLSGLSLIIVDGDTSGNTTTSSSYRRVNQQWDFTTETVSVAGLYVLGSGTTPNVDLTISSGALQNGSQTYALVNTADIAYEVGDPDELTAASVAAITLGLIDAVGYIDGASDHLYFGATDISDGSGFAIDSAQRIPNGTDTDAVGDWVTQSTFSPALELADSNATPGLVNVIPEPTSSVLLGLALLGGVAARRRR